MIVNCEKSVVPIEKVADYLLNENNPQNKGKAKFFKQIGYEENPKLLLSDLQKLACEGEEILNTKNAFGRKIKLLNKLTAPNRKTYFLTTIWVILNKEDIPKFVTAYPD